MSDTHTYADEQVGAQQEGPVTPYPEADGSGKTSGWTGSETSHERALAEDADGVTSRRQQRVMYLLRMAGWLGPKQYGQHNGITVKEVRDITGWHHGQASSALSVLHKEGKIARLTARRDRCAVYVLPEYVGGRETAAPGRQARTPAPPTLTDSEQFSLESAKRNTEHGWMTPTSHVRMLVETIERLTRG
jgi:hypothetical protein